MAIQRDINLLQEPFKTKSKVFLAIARKKYPNIYVFETLRSYQRQLLLFAKGMWITRTMKSKHREWKAMDIVFLYGWQPKRQWDYNFIHYIAEMCWMRWLKWESCHIEDDGRSIMKLMADNSWRWGWSDTTTQYRLKEVNWEFRKYLPATQ